MTRGAAEERTLSVALIMDNLWTTDNCPIVSISSESIASLIKQLWAGARKPGAVACRRECREELADILARLRESCDRLCGAEHGGDPGGLWWWSYKDDEP